MLVLSWNLFHGRAAPPAGRPLLHEFASTLAGWSWDVALLQEVPPWWPPLLAAACGPGAAVAAVPTSRNALLPLRRALAARRPDLLRSNGGGANAILVRGNLRIDGHLRLRLRAWPERRVLHAVRLGGRDGDPLDGAWVANLHAQKGEWDDGPGLRRPWEDLSRAVTRLDAWTAATEPDERRSRAGSDGAAGPGVEARTDLAGILPTGALATGAATTSERRPPIVLGGDLNLPREAVDRALAVPWGRIASHGPDHVVGRGVVARGDSTQPDRGTLSDHAPLAVTVAAVPTG